MLPEYVYIDTESDIMILINLVRHISLELGLSPFESSLIASACSEIATNVIRYATSGVAEVKLTDNRMGIEINIQDHGSGIPNLELAMTDGYSTFPTKSLGLGLGAAKRSCDEMIIDTGPKSTSITLKKYLPVCQNDIDIGVVSFPAEGESSNGDGYLIAKYGGDKVFVAVLDAAGKGSKAAKSTKILLTFLGHNYKLPFEQLIEIGHDFLLKNNESRGIELALVRITSQKIETLLLGNVSASVNCSNHSIPIQNGSLGLSVPEKIYVNNFERPKNFSMFMHTDGIIKVDSQQIFERMSSAQSTAEYIFNNHALVDDDATIVMINCQ
ncbi:ATP-binding protein [Shewanella subflava]|uniref:Histidine kinase/HSP90-like ATPase domain-containing protein n=1 Tax=Shewanella subflava TaxID=2986476 RepID=A0ABT3I9L9_9GAMM|nr:ATP-binding protein [Shewanella subflava]MCW3172629.1 hypothetical protein [Shewanella subflava]